VGEHLVDPQVWWWDNIQVDVKEATFLLNELVGVLKVTEFLDYSSFFSFERTLPRGVRKSKTSLLIYK
jgi:hypothetical protein